MAAPYLGEMKKIQKLLTRIVNYIEVTNDKILVGNGMNLKALMILFYEFTKYDTGTPKFFQKIERLLQNDITRKEYKLDEPDLTKLMKTLAKRRCTNEAIWRALFTDWDALMNIGAINNIHIYYFLRATDAAGFSDSEVTEVLVEYIVRRGYDAEDLETMSSKEGGFRRAVHFIQLIADTAPNLKNKHFLNHVETFVKNNMDDMPVIQLLKLLQSLKRLANFEDEQLLTKLRKATVGKKVDIVENKKNETYEITKEDVEEQDLKSRPEESGFFTESEDEFGNYNAHYDSDFEVDEEEFQRQQDQRDFQRKK